MIQKLQKEIHANAREKGWWPEGDDDTNNIMEKLMLVVTEIAEAAEEHRNYKTGDGIYYSPSPDTMDGKPEGFGIELADTVIRIFDLAEYLGIDMQKCIEIKMKYNTTRSLRHGGKRC
jgi:NTP pyrophosphatase (non-canonical NTP hydrolase)